MDDVGKGGKRDNHTPWPSDINNGSDGSVCYCHSDVVKSKSSVCLILGTREQIGYQVSAIDVGDM